MNESILFWPVKLKGSVLTILDETRIPHKISYLKVRNYHGAIKAIVDMKTRAFGQFLTVCYTFLLEAKNQKALNKEEWLGHLAKVATAFNESRPTFPFREVTQMMLGMAHKVCGEKNHIKAFESIVNDLLENGIRRQRYQRAQRAASFIKNGDAVLTHCHVSGEMSLIGEFCRADKKEVKFFATETRPYFQGARLTAWELKRGGFDVTLVADNAVASLMCEGKINLVIVGSDRSAKNGDFANKIGTYQIALLARHFRIPFYVLAQPSKQLKSGRDIPIEVRCEDEILVFEGRRLAHKKVRAYYPGFDVVDNRLVTEHIAIHM
jgi:methylthioribose-1-phosphate isomerase